MVGTLVFLASIFYSLPSNVVSDRGKVNPLRALSVDLAPQGWAFFTKPPSEPDLFFYDSTSLKSLMITPQGRSDNLFGLSRTQRAQGPEGANMLLRLTDEDWHQCETGDKLETCIKTMESNKKKVHKVDHRAPIKTLCGEVIVVQAAPTAWSYRGLTPETHTPLHVVKLSVKC